MSENQIPLTWEHCVLSDLGDISSGGTPSTKNPELWGDDIPWISPSDLTGYTAKYIARGAKSLSKKGLLKSSAKLMPAGSVHFSSRAPIGYVAISSQSLCTNQGFKSLAPANGVFNEYVYFHLKSIKALANSLATGTTFKELSGKAFAKLPIPLPPLAEQRRIVAKIEELFSELDAGEESLRRARRQLGVYRQSLLKQAFEGKLTEPWRKQNPHLLEDPEQLLKRIQAERKTRYEQQLKEWKIALKDAETNDEKRPPKPAILKPVSGSIAIFEMSFPPEWNSLNLSQIALELGQGWSPKCLNHAADAGQWGVMKTTAIQAGRFQAEASKVLPSNFSPRPWLGLRHNDILITRAGPRSRCGVVCRVVGDHPKLLLCDKAYRLAFAQEVTSSEFIELLLCSPVASDAIEKLKTGINDSGVNITQTIFLQLVVPVPSLPEQQEIVRLLDEQFTVIEQNEREIDAALKRSAALRQSILKKAFTGQLVPQDPTDEPASTLLERIRAEREATPSATSRRTKIMK